MPAAATSSRESALLKLPPAEPAAALGVLCEGAAQVARVEVRPQAVYEHELGVGELPEHEVRDADLAARADQQVGIGKLGRIEVRGEDVLVDLARGRRRSRRFAGPPARAPPGRRSRTRSKVRSGCSARFDPRSTT